MSTTISGFSKLSKSKKIEWLTNTYFSNPSEAQNVLKGYWNSDEQLQKLHDDFIENTISNYYLPLGVAPNFKINNKLFTIPMAIEESSVVAAASKAAKYWLDRGGFKTRVISTTKVGQVHFKYYGPFKTLRDFFNSIKSKLFEDTKSITKNMEARGGGILNIELKDKSDLIEHYFQLHCTFETLDAMGANFINSCLEQFAQTLKREAKSHLGEDLDIVMSILSNYVPNCIVKSEVSCPVEMLSDSTILSPETFATKFVEAIKIAELEPFRAVTHNKGVMNGVDAVVLATGNDFRAIEAGAHAYASKDGQYRSLTHARIEDGVFKFWIELPLALGTVGGLTRLHPLVKFSLELLGNPSAKELMQIVATAGLAQNFAAVRSLITTGIQEGHMKMHLTNILNQYDLNSSQKDELREQFKNVPVTHSAVVDAIEKLQKTTNAE